MTGVVLRCPNCGTTQSVEGECEACAEAKVRYYCSNHTPGRWLDSKTCSQCGAVYGRTTPPPAAPGPSRWPPAAPGPSRRPPAAPGPPKRPPAAPPPPRRDRPEPRTPPRTPDSWGPAGPWTGRPPPPPADEADIAREEEIARARALERLHEWIRNAEARRRDPPPPDEGVPSVPAKVGGFLRKAMKIAFYLIV